MSNLDINFTLLIQLGNFLITLVVLNYLLIKPIRDQMKARQDLTLGYVSDIEHFTSLAENKVSTYQTALDNARQEAIVERDALKADGHTKEQDILAAAQHAAQNQLKASREVIAAETQEALAALKAQIPAFTEKAVSRILG